MGKHQLTIMHLITDLDLGGAEQMLYKIVSHSKKSAFRNIVVSLTDAGPIGKEITKAGVRVYTLQMKSGKPDPRGIIKLVRLLKSEPVDILQTWLYHADLLGFIAGKISRVPKIVWGIRCSEMRLGQYGKLTYYTIHLCAILSVFVDSIIINSNAGMIVHRKMGYYKCNMTVIPNGFNTTLFKPDPLIKNTFKKNLGLNDSEILIGMVARFDPMKDHGTFLKAAAILAGRDTRAHFALIGKGMEEGNRNLMSEVPSILENRLHLLGERNDMPHVMNGIDIFTNASFGEGFSNVIGEAMASGTVCVVSDVGDSAAIVGDTGIVVKAADPVELFNAWDGILKMGTDDLIKMRTRARNRISEFFTIESIVTRFEEHYQGLFRK